MAQVTIYLQEDAARRAREQAKRANKSLSAYVAELVLRDAAPAAWPKDLVDLLREGEGDLVEPADPPPEDVDSLT